MGELNLLPIELKQKNTKVRTALLSAAIAVAILVALIVGMIIPKVVIVALESKDNKLKRDIEMKQYIAEENKKLNTKIGSYNQYFDMIKNITSNNQKVAFKLTEMSDELPTDVIVTKYDMDSENIVLTANSSNYNSICSFVASLECSKKYKYVQLQNIDSDGSKYICNITIIK